MHLLNVATNVKRELFLPVNGDWSLEVLLSAGGSIGSCLASTACLAPDGACGTVSEETRTTLGDTPLGDWMGRKELRAGVAAEV